MLRKTCRVLTASKGPKEPNYWRRREQQRQPIQGKQSPQIYPFQQPFDDTPFDEDKFSFDVRAQKENKERNWPAWMDSGLPGTGHGIGLNRAHPLSPLKGNDARDIENITVLYGKIAQGVRHPNGQRFISRAGKAPDVTQIPYLTGEPCPIYGWKVTDREGIRKFESPHIDDKSRYKAYVSIAERKLMDETDMIAPTKAVKPAEKEPESTTQTLKKRLFFWK